MKLLNKLLTATLPVSLVGILIPTIVSCSCNKKSLALNYKDTINCMFNDKEHYHKRGDIANALKQHLVKEDRKEIQPSLLNEINDKFANDSKVKQLFFWDLAAAYTIIAEQDVYLDAWEETEATVQFKLNNDNLLTNKTLRYVKNGKNIDIQISDVSETVKSYVFSDCWME